MRIAMMWKSTSSNGWEYFDYVWGLEFDVIFMNLWIFMLYIWMWDMIT